jgi:hypothetical protein
MHADAACCATCCGASAFSPSPAVPCLIPLFTMQLGCAHTCQLRTLVGISFRSPSPNLHPSPCDRLLLACLRCRFGRSESVPASAPGHAHLAACCALPIGQDAFHPLGVQQHQLALTPAVAPATSPASTAAATAVGPKALPVAVTVPVPVEHDTARHGMARYSGLGQDNKCGAGGLLHEVDRMLKVIAGATLLRTDQPKTAGPMTKH